MAWEMINAAAAVLLALLSYLLISRLSRGQRQVPPGPFSWPVVGSLLSVGKLRHRSFAALAKKYGPIMYLHLGARPHLIISSADLAREMLKDHDVEFASRPQYSTFSKHASHNFNDLLFSPYGERWKFLRRICGMELFTPAKVHLFSTIRKRELDRFGRSIQAAADKGEVINMSIRLHELFTNFMTGVLFGMKFFGSSTEEVTPEARNYKEKWDVLIEETQRVYVGDFIPALHWLDKLRNLERRFEKEVMPAITGFLKGIVDEHKRSYRADAPPRDFVDVMLSLSGQDKVDDEAVIAILQNMLLAGTITSRATLEWALSELLRNPRVMLRAQEELDKVVDRNRFVDESDLKDLEYMQALVKEVLRTHPVAPLGIPKCNLKEATVAGYRIPANTTLLVNIWAIARDPSAWSQAEEFRPERFLGSDINVLGAHFDLLPFSSGRRRCIGIPLALPHVTLTLSYLLHRFNWKPAAEIDMSETTGQACLRAQQLLTIVTPRQVNVEP